MSPKVNTEDRTAFGNLIRNLRLERGLTQDDVGDAIGVNQQAVAMYEDGDRPFEAVRIPALCTVLKVTPNDLFSQIGTVVRSGDGSPTVHNLKIAQRLSILPESIRRPVVRLVNDLSRALNGQGGENDTAEKEVKRGKKR